MNPRKSRKPPEIIEFEDVFSLHSKEAFVGRKRLFGEIDKFLNATTVNSPFLLIQGESGIGKTALMANYVRDRRDDYIHYFIEYNTDTTNPQTLIDHLYYALGWQHGLSDLSLGGKPITSSILKNRVWEVSRDSLSSGDIQTVFIDALDESLVDNMTPSIQSIITVLNTLKFPDNFRVVVSSAREIRDIPELWLSFGRNNPVTISGSAEENRADVAQYFRDNLPLEDTPKKDLDDLVDASEGNFQYAILVVRDIADKSITVETLMHEPPRGLYGLYDLKLGRIQDTLSESVRNHVSRVIKLISAYGHPLAPNVICDILQIDGLITKDIFGPIELFMDLSLYHAAPCKCKWFHRSFDRYIKKRSELQGDLGSAPYLDAVVSYVRIRLEAGQTRDIPYALLRWFVFDCLHLCSTNAARLEQLQYLKSTYFFSLSKELEVIETVTLSRIAYICYTEAAAHRSVRHMLFFRLLGHAYRYCTNKADYVAKLREDHLRLSGNSALKRLGAAHTPRSISVEGIRAFLHGAISYDDLSIVSDYAFSLICESFGDISTVYEKCHQLTDEWLPPEEEMERASRATSAPAKDLYQNELTVYVGSQLNRKCAFTTVKEYREKGHAGRFSIFLEDTERQELIILGNDRMFRVGDYRPFRAIRYLLKHVGQEVNYNSLFVDGLEEQTGRLKKHEISADVYQCLKRINDRLAKEPQAKKHQADKWFQIKPGQAKVAVWERLNSCLITKT